MKNEKKVTIMPAALDIDLKSLENSLPNPNRVSLSKLRDSSSWLPLLDKHRIVEIISGSETVALINDPTLITDLLELVHEQKKQIEQLQINTLYGERLHEANFKSGDDLKNAAFDYLDQLMPD